MLPVLQSGRAITLVLLCSGLLFACAGRQADTNIDNLAEAQLYEQAQAALRDDNFLIATELLRRLEADYPFGNYTQSAQLGLIYAYYKSGDIELAEASAKRFIRLHPNHQNVDYAYYLRGLAAFPEPANFLQDMFNTDLSRKSMASAQTSYQHFAEFTKTFADSLYADDARQRMLYLRNLMARHELNIANYYLNYQAYPAAINRARYVLENFQQAVAIPDALAILVVAYRKLGLYDQAENYLALLRANFPDYPAFDRKGNFSGDYAQTPRRSLGRWLSLGIISNSLPPGFDSREFYGD